MLRELTKIFRVHCLQNQILKSRAIIEFLTVALLLCGSAGRLVFASENKYQRKDSLASFAADSHFYLPSVGDANYADDSIAIGDFANASSARSAVFDSKSVYVDTMTLRIPMAYRCNIKLVVKGDVVDPHYMDNSIQLRGIDGLIGCCYQYREDFSQV